MSARGRSLQISSAIATSRPAAAGAPAGTEIGQKIIDIDQAVAEVIEKKQRQGDTVIVSEDDDEITVTLVDGEDDIEIEVTLDKPSEMSKLNMRKLSTAGGISGSDERRQQNLVCPT